MGKIHIHGMSFFGFHGVSPAEKELAGRFTVDIEFPLDTEKAASNDSLEDTVNYEMIYNKVKDVVTQNKFHLVETLAETIAQSVIDGWNLRGIRVKVKKINPPFPGHLDFVEVTVEKGEID